MPFIQRGPSRNDINSDNFSSEIPHLCQIGISVYKQPLQWLKKSIASALSQSKTSNCFCTVRLDGPYAYTLETLNWLFSCFKSNPQIEIQIGSRRIGTFASYREIFKRSESTYLCQLDADDWLEENILSRCIQRLNSETNTPFAYTKYQIVNPLGEPLQIGQRTREEFNALEQLVQFNTFHLRVIRRSAYNLVGGYNPRLKYTGDYDISLKLAEAGTPAFINEIGYSYRKHQGNTSSRFKEDVAQESFDIAKQSLNRRKKEHLYHLALAKKHNQIKVTLQLRKGPILIAGMHRSGTSVVTMMLRKAGVDMGKKLLRGDNNNLHGYFEDISALHINRRVLLSSGRHPDWGYALNHPKNKHQYSAENLWSQSSDYLRLRSQANHLWGWKDPRNSLLLDYWSHIEPGIRVIAVFRPPWDVAASLARAHKIFRDNEQLAAQTWILFNQNLLQFFGKNRHKCILIRSCHAIKNPQKLIAHTENNLGLPGLGAVATSSELQNVVDPDIYKCSTPSHQLIDHWRNKYPRAVSTFNRMSALSNF